MSVPGPEELPTAAPQEEARARHGLRAALVVGFLVWLVGAALTRSLWADELHALHHVRAPSWASFFDAVRSDNHPPLAFVLQRASVALFGESPLALRLPSLLCGLGLIVLAGRLARGLPCSASRRAAPWLVVLSSYAFVVLTEARMYGLLAVAMLAIVDRVQATLEGEPGRWWVATWVAVALHAHYYAVHDLFVLAIAVAGIALARPECRARARTLLLPAIVGALTFVPWALYGLRAQLLQEYPPGGHLTSPRALVDTIAHIFLWQASLGGAFVVRFVALPGMLAAAVLGLLGLARLWNRSDLEAERSRTLLALLGALGLAAPLWCLGVANVFERSAYALRYVSASAVPVLLIAAAGFVSRGGRLRLLPQAVLLATMPIVVLVNAASGGREDFRAACEHIRANARPGDALVLKPLWERGDLPSPTGWDVYGGPAGAPDGPFELALLPAMEVTRAKEHRRAWTFARDDYSPWILRNLRRSSAREESWAMGPDLRLYLFTR